MIKRPAFVAYPFLAALYPVLALAAAHGGELVGVQDVARPLAWSLCVAAAAWMLGRGVTADPHRRAIVAFVTVVVFAAYGYWQTLVKDVFGLHPLAEPAVLLPIAGAIVGITAWGARQPGPSRPMVSRYLNITMGILVAGTALALGWRLIAPRPEVRLAEIPPTFAGIAGPQPHVFLIVLDKYTGPRSLRANYGYDNSNFERFLESRGFQVARNAHANYIHTFLALASLLNWQYLDDVADSLGPGESRWDVLYQLIEDNRTTRALKERGYRFVFMPSAFAATASNDLADVQLPHPNDLTREFEAVWFRTTLLFPLADAWCARRRCMHGLLPYVAESAESLDWKFEQLSRLAASSSPLFVLAHLTLPHEPYLFDASCAHIPPYWPVRDDGPDAEPVKRAYIAQLQCVNRKLANLIGAIQREAGRPAVVVLQADHGHGRLGRDQPPLSAAPSEKVRERLDIFAAYHLPGAPPTLVHDSIGPVNAMRAIMGHYFGLPLPPLEEASYWSGHLRPYQLTRVR